MSVVFRALSSFEQGDFPRAFKSLETLEVLNSEKVVQIPSWQHNYMVTKAAKSLLRAYAQLQVNSNNRPYEYVQRKTTREQRRVLKQFSFAKQELLYLGIPRGLANTVFCQEETAFSCISVIVTVR